MQVTGENLMKRSDDNAETLQARLSSFHQATDPLIDYYKKRGILHTVDSSKKPGEVFQAICAAFTSAKSKDKVSFV